MAAACAAPPGVDTDSRLPPWIILDDEAYVEDRENATTTAVGKTSVEQRDAAGTRRP